MLNIKRKIENMLDLLRLSDAKIEQTKASLE